jgi:hypothetical protein
MSLPLELLVVSNPHTHLNSHQPQNVTGELEDSVTGQIIQKLITPKSAHFFHRYIWPTWKSWNLHMYTRKRGN